MSETQQIVANLQHSLLFLQQEHAHTLKDLQSQISALQTKCTQQNFQLMTLNVRRDDDNAPVVHLETEVASVKKVNGELRTSLESREKRIIFLEEQMKSKEKRYQDDLKNALRRIQELELELDNRASNIAYMTTQLHQAKLINLQNDNGRVTVEIQNATTPPQQTKLLRTSATPELEASPRVAGAPVTQASFSPTPPKQVVKAGKTVRRSQPNVATASLDGAISESGSSQQLPAGAEVTSAAAGKSKVMSSSSRMPKQQPLREDSGPARPSIGLSQARKDRHGDLRLSNSGVALTQRRAMGKAQPVHRPNDYEEIMKLSKSTDKSGDLTVPVAPPTKAEPLPPIVTSNGRQIRKGRPTGGQPTKPARSSREVEQLVVEPISSPDKHLRTTANSARNTSK